MTGPAHSDAGARRDPGDVPGDPAPPGHPTPWPAPSDPATGGGPLHAQEGEDTRPEWAARALGMPEGPAEGGLGALGEVPIAVDDGGPVPEPQRRPRVPVGVALAAEGRVAVTLLVAGLGVDVLWRAIVPDVARSGNPLEAAAAVDGTLALLGLVAGAVTGAAVLARPGARPLVRAAVALAASMVAASFPWWLSGNSGRVAAVIVAVAALAATALARRGGATSGRAARLAGSGLVVAVALWLLVESLGDSPLRAAAAVLVWPLVTAGALFVGALFPALSRHLDDPPPT